MKDVEIGTTHSLENLNIKKHAVFMVHGVAFIKHVFVCSIGFYCSVYRVSIPSGKYC